MKIFWAKPFINNKDIQYLNDAANLKWVAKGPYVENFEKRLKNF